MSVAQQLSVPSDVAGNERDPAASVSSATSGRPSHREEITTASAAPMKRLASAWAPTRRTRVSTPSSEMSRSNGSRNGPSPISMSDAQGIAATARTVVA